MLHEFTMIIRWRRLILQPVSAVADELDDGPLDRCMMPVRGQGVDEPAGRVCVEGAGSQVVRRCRRDALSINIWHTIAACAAAFTSCSRCC